MKRLILVTIVLSVSAATPGVGARSSSPRARASAIELYATGLNNPRGLAFGPDGNLYVAEAGLGGTNSTVGQCTPQVVPPVGPYTGGLTASISKISPAGVRTTVIDHLPSAQTSPALGRDKE